MVIDGLSYQISKLWRRIKVAARRTDRTQVVRAAGIVLVAVAVLGTSPEKREVRGEIEIGKVGGIETNNHKEDLSQLSTPNSQLPTLPFRLPISPPEASISAQAAFVIDGETDAVLYEKNPDQRLPMASLTKIMTAVVVLDEFPLDEIVTVPELCTNLPPPKVGYASGQRLTVEELLYGMLVASASDASCALSHHFGGDFLQLMNRKAEELGLTQTHFENEVGLDGENGNHLSTARDLVKLSEEAMRSGVLRKIVGTTQWRNLTSTNELLFTLPGTTGIKTGYTEQAQGCLAVSYERGGREAIGVILGSGDRFADAREILNWIFKN